MPDPRAFYFGCYRGLGHNLHDDRGNTVRWKGRAGAWQGWEVDGLPWIQIDGALTPRGRGVYEMEGVAVLHHKDGWTALAFADRSIDSRPGSNSVFIFEAVLTFAQAVVAAREHFAEVVERFGFDIRPAPVDRGGDG